MPTELVLPRYLKTTTGPLELEFLGHDSIEHFNKDAGEENAVLEAAERFYLHRDVIFTFHAAFTPFLERISGFPRGIDEKRTEKRKAQSVNPENISPQPEKFSTYLARVWAKSDEATQAVILREALRVSRTIFISAAPAARKTPIEPMFYKRADSILEADLDTINSRVSKFLSLVPEFQLARDCDEKPLRDSLARLCQKFEAARFVMED